MKGKRIGTLEDLGRHVVSCSARAENGCLEWQNTRNTFGYGVVRWLGRNYLTHRASWMAHRGDPGDLYVLHRCDNPACIDPDHLFLGTKQDNVDDMISKGRQQRYQRLFSPDQLVAIRAEYAFGEVSQRTLATKYLTCQANIWRALTRYAT